MPGVLILTVLLTVCMCVCVRALMLICTSMHSSSGTFIYAQSCHKQQRNEGG